MKEQRRIFILYGPTGVGKSDIALTLARAISGEIINMDVGQFYVPFSIGTSKPRWRESDVVHHFFDILDTPLNMTVVDYRARLMTLLDTIWSRGKVPIVTGGSGFYLYSILFPMREGRGIESEVRSELEVLQSWDDLRAVDPERARVIHKNDVYRIRQALRMFSRTGLLPSALQPIYSPPALYTVFFLERERNELYGRIGARLQQMIAAGWIDEVRAVVGSSWEQFLCEKKLIGYDELLTFVRGHATLLTAVVENIRQRTCRYAKRQITFWNFLQKKIRASCIRGDENTVVLNLSEQTEAEIVRRLIQRIRI